MYRAQFPSQRRKKVGTILRCFNGLSAMDLALVRNLLCNPLVLILVVARTVLKVLIVPT